MPSCCGRFCLSWQGFSSRSKVAFTIIERRSRFCGMSSGQLSDLPRKSVEPIALKAGSPPRSLQEFLTHLEWDGGTLRDQVQRIVATEHLSHGTSVGLVDETSFAKKKTKTPGIQRQWCGHLGKVENCMTTSHFGVTCGSFQALLDGDLFLPASRSFCGNCRLANKRRLVKFLKTSAAGCRVSRISRSVPAVVVVRVAGRVWRRASRRPSDWMCCCSDIPNWATNSGSSLVPTRPQCVGGQTRDVLPGQWGGIAGFATNVGRCARGF